VNDNARARARQWDSVVGQGEHVESRAIHTVLSIVLQPTSLTLATHVSPNHNSQSCRGAIHEVACHNLAAVAPRAQSRLRTSSNSDSNGLGLVVWELRYRCHCIHGIVLRQDDAAHSNRCSSHRHCSCQTFRGSTTCASITVPSRNACRCLIPRWPALPAIAKSVYLHFTGWTSLDCLLIKSLNVR
jgi:hypothetical protein